jgi:hypothetical protein
VIDTDPTNNGPDREHHLVIHCGTGEVYDCPTYDAAQALAADHNAAAAEASTGEEDA